MPHKTFKVGEVGYPRLLREIPNAPACIYVNGVLQLERPLVAIVGTRQASEEGKRTAKQFAKELSEAGFGVVSGLALGIDTAAHKGALEAKAYTVAILGNSIDTIYPAENIGLGQEIISSGGAILSEYAPGAATQKQNFIDRNRIISGLSIAVVVIEAPIHSGALVTARTGAEQGKEVFVVPGSIRDPNFDGSHQLIRDGAILVSSTAEVLEDLNLT